MASPFGSSLASAHAAVCKHLSCGDSPGSAPLRAQRVEGAVRPARSRSPQEQQLEAVLSAIEERAIDSPERALFEVDDGVAAINAAASHLGVERASERQIVFVERMQELSAEENADVTADEVEGLRAQLRHRLSHLERERVERRYLAAVDRLGPVDRWLELRWAERELRTRHAD